jgi:hypothetical protein
MTAATVEIILKLKLKCLLHPAYIPALTPSDYHISGVLEDVLHGYQFSNDDKLKDAVYTWLPT